MGKWVSGWMGVGRCKRGECESASGCESDHQIYPHQFLWLFVVCEREGVGVGVGGCKCEGGGMCKRGYEMM